MTPNGIEADRTADISVWMASGVLYPAAKKPSPPALDAASTIAGFDGPPDIGAATTGMVSPKSDKSDVIVGSDHDLGGRVMG